MGEEDHLFLPAIKKVVTKHLQATLLIIENCGHVVNIEQSDIFNKKTIQFINSQ
jgi:pimeloyl-ACP methyl ester carboxylesterase